MTDDFVRYIPAPDSVTAQDAAKALAVADGYRVRTVKSVRLTHPPSQMDPAVYKVTLAVEVKP